MGKSERIEMFTDTPAFLLIYAGYLSDMMIKIVSPKVLVKNHLGEKIGMEIGCLFCMIEPLKNRSRCIDPPNPKSWCNDL
jgi:hypothetical protein